jgi:hypothetical protein
VAVCILISEAHEAAHMLFRDRESARRMVWGRHADYHSYMPSLLTTE